MGNLRAAHVSHFMLKNKLSHTAISEEKIEKLQELANQFSAITGHSIDDVEDGIVRLITSSQASNVAMKE